jgi:hypothetical protein
MKSTKQNAVKADYHTTDWPYQFVLAFKTVHYSAQHFLNFFVKQQHHHRSRYWQQTTNLGYPHRKSKQQQIQQQQVHIPRGWSLGVA